MQTNTQLIPAETIVSWDVQLDDNCQIPMYTLGELSQRLGISSASSIAEGKHQEARGNVREPKVGAKRGQAGWQALRRRRVSDFVDLWKMRGSFRRRRNNAVFYYSLLLAQWGIPIQKAKAAAEQLNASCRPPLKQTTVQACVKSAYSRRYKKLYDQTVADWLDITPEEASSLKCKLTATRFNVESDKPVAKPKRIDEDTARIASRHAAIRRIISEAKGVVPSSRKMANTLDVLGFHVTHMTVSKDYKALGFKTRQLDDEYSRK